MDRQENTESTEPQTMENPRAEPGSEQAENGASRANRLVDGPLITRVFFNERELRSGWRVLIFAVLWGVFVACLFTLTRGYWAAVGGTRALFASEALMLISALASAGILSVIEKRSFADYGLPWRRAFGGGFWRGVLWGAIALTALLGLIHFFHGFRFGPLVTLGRRELLFGAGGFGVVFLIVGVFEEFLFRGYPLYTLSEGIGFWPAAILLSAAFGAVHLNNGGENWVGALSAGLVGLFLCFTVRRTGNLWFAIGLHATWDYSESFVFAAPDSGTRVARHLFNSSFSGPRWLTGGSVGPEGSIFVFVVIAILFILLHLLYPQTKSEAACPKAVTSNE